MAKMCDDCGDIILGAPVKVTVLDTVLFFCDLDCAAHVVQVDKEDTQPIATHVRKTDHGRTAQ